LRASDITASHKRCSKAQVLLTHQEIPST
jgi:hypothetical protein